MEFYIGLAVWVIGGILVDDIKIQLGVTCMIIGHMLFMLP